MKRIIAVLFLLTLAGIALAPPAAAAAPANDHLADATVITGRSGSIAGTNVEATGETGEVVYTTPIESVWYSWTPTRTGPVTFETCTNFSFDTTLAAYTGAAFPLTRLAESDDACGRGSRVAFDAVGGETYRIQVDGYSSDQGTFTLSWAQTVNGPANDDLGSPAGLLAEGGTRNNTNVGGTKEAGEADHAGDAGGASVWYAWTAPRNGTATVEVDAEFDTLLAVYTQGGTGHAGLALAAENDDRADGDATSALSFTAYEGETYLIAVDGKADAQGTFDLTWGLPPANDAIGSAMALDPQGETVITSNRYATAEVDEPDHAGVAGGASVWFSWTAPYDGWTEINTAGSSVDTLLHLYERTGDGMAGITALAGNDDVDAEFTTSLLRHFVNGGTTYLIAVDGKAGATGDVQLNLGQAPAADLVGQAETLTGVSGTNAALWNVLAGAEDGEPAHAGQPAAKSLWYKWQATDDGRAFFSTTGTSFDTVLGVYTQPGTTPAELIEVTSNDDAGEGDTTSAVTFITSAGTDYYVAVDGKAGALGQVALHWRSGPVNDDRAYATVVTGDAGTVSGTNVNATWQADDPGVVDWYGGGRTVWFEWTAPTSGGAQFALSNWTTSYYTPSVRAFAPNPDGTFTVAPDAEYTWGWYGNTQTRFRATAGTTYLVGVDAAYFDSGRFDLTWSRIPAPANDDFASSSTWATDSGNGSADNHWATKETGEPDHAGAAGGASLWFDWTPSISGTARIDVDPYDADGVAAVYTGDAVDALTLVHANDDRYSGYTDPYLRFPVTAGTTYRIAVDHKNARLTSMNFSWSVVATPANDDLADATVLGLEGGSLTGQDSTGAMLESGEPVHAGRNGGASLWYAFTAPETGGTFRFAARTGCDGCWWVDQFAAAYTGDGASVATLTEVVAQDNAPYVYYPRLLIPTTPGTTYYVAVDAPNGEARNFTAEWDLVPTPANDAFSSPTTIEGATGLIDFTNVGATEEAGEPVIVPGRDGQQSVWFSWTAPSDGTAVFETAGSSIRTLLGLYTGEDLAALTQLASSFYRDVDGNGASRVNIPVVAGTTYRIAVDGDGVANGALTLQWTLDPPPANDDFADATLLDAASGTVIGTNVGATEEPGEPNHGYVNGGTSIWYRFVAPFTGAATFTTTGSDNNSVLGIYTGSAVGQLASIAQDNDSGGESAARIRFQMTEGQTYHVALDTVDGFVGELTLNYAFRAPDANDDFATPVVLEGAGGSVAGSNIGATTQSGEPCCDGSSVWFTWTAPVNGEVRFTTSSPTAPGTINAIRAFTGSEINGLADVGYTQHSWNYGSSVARFPVVAGTTYRVAIYSYYWYAQQYDFILNYNIGPPEHDAFSAPKTLHGTADTDTSVNLGATEEAGEPDHAGQAGNSSVWYTWTAPADGSATIDLAGSTFDTLLGVYTGVTVDALTGVVSNDDAAEGTASSVVNFEATGGTTYRIAVDGKGTAQGGVQLALDLEVPELSIGDVVVDEAAGNASFTISRGGALHLPASVEWAAQAGSATADDLTLASSNGTPVAFAADETAKVVTVPITSDAIDEEDETFGVSLFGATGAVIIDGWAVGTITDDDLPPSITWSGGSTSEGHEGTTTVTFTATLSGPSGRYISVAAATANGTAFAPSDYEVANLSLGFGPGELEKTFTVTVNGDTTDEDDQSFTAALSSPVNVSLPEEGLVATGTILDDDPPPDVTVADAATVTEVAGGVNANFTVTLSARSEKTVQVGFATADGTALVSRGDYTGRTGTLSFAPGETSKVLTVNVLDDIYDEFNQQFTMQLTSATNGNIVDATGVGTIVDEDAQPTASIADASATEGGSLSFAVTTSAPSEKPINIPFITGGASPVTEPATTNAGALGGADFAFTSGSVDLAQDETTATIVVATNADTLHEYDETFGVVFGDPTNVDYADGQALGTILNDDAAPALTVQDASFVEGHTGLADHAVDITLSAPSGRRISVAYAIAGGTATATDDYRTESGTRNFAPGDQTETVLFGVAGDLTDEFDQTALVTLSAPVDADLGRAEATLTISDDDEPPAITIADAPTVTEAAGGVDAVFTVSLERASEKTVTVDWTTLDGTALVARGDYTAGAGTVTFVAGDASETVTVEVLDDIYDEFEQQFSVQLAGAGNGTIAGATAAGRIVDEDAQPTASIADASATEGGSLSFAVTTSAPSEKPINIPFITGGASPVTEPATTDAGALGGADFAFTSGSVDLAQDETTATIVVATNADTLHEYDETFGVVFGDPTNVDYADGQAVGTVLNDDAEPTAYVLDVAVDEGDTGTTDHAIEVTLDAPSGRRISVGYAIAANTATVVDDFTATSGTLVFAPGDQSESATFTVVGDVIDEYDQTARLTLSTPVDVTLGSLMAGLTITDDDLPPVVSFTTASPSVDEPAGPVRLTAGLDLRSEKSILIPVLLEDVTTSAADRGDVSPTFVFTPGNTTTSFDVPIVDDTTDEPEQAFRLTMQAADDVRLPAAGDEVRTVTIIDDDLAPLASLTDADSSVDEGAGSASTVVRLSQHSEWPVTVTVGAVDVTTSAADHGAPTPAPVAFPIGTTEQTVTATITDDATDEPDQAFRLELTGGEHVRFDETAGQGDVTFTIVDDDAPPTVTLAGPASVDESQAVAAYQVTLSAISELDVTVSLSLTDGTSDGLDHGALLPVSPIVVPAGSNGTAVTVELVDDDLDEADETYTVALVSAVNGTATGSPVTTTIVDDDATPVTSGIEAGTDEDAATVIALSATDADGGSLTYTVVTEPTLGSVALTGSEATYTPMANANGTDSFTYVATDGTNTSAPATVTVTVRPVNDRPEASDTTAVMAEDGTIEVPLADLVADVETADADLALAATAVNGLATFDGLTLRYAPNANVNGVDTVTVTFGDRGDPNGCGATGPACADAFTDEAVITVTITAVNDEPTAADATVELLEDAAPVAIDLGSLVADVETGDDALTYEVVTGPSSGVLGGSGRNRTYTPAADTHGDDAFTYRVTDSGDGAAAPATSATRTVTLQVASVNDLPVAGADEATTNQEASVVIDVLADDTDVEGLDAATLAVVAGPEHGTAVVEAGQIRYTPADAYAGADNFTYRICDTDAACTTAAVDITVLPNRLPVTEADAVTTDEDTASAPVLVLANDVDPDGHGLTVTATTDGALGSVACTDAGSCVYTPAADANGADSFTYTVDDGHGGTAVGTVSVTVTPVQDVPVAVADSATTDEDTPSQDITVLGNDADADGDTLTVSGFTQGAIGSVACTSAGVCVYTPAPDAHGSDSFTYTASDGQGGRTDGVVSITVSSVDDLPVAVADEATLAEDGSIDIDVVANDTGLGDGGTVVGGLSTPNHGAASIVDGSVRYTPVGDFHGTDSLTYRVTDADGDEATATVAITVTPVNDAPEATAIAATTLEDAPVVIDVVAHGTDVDGDDLTVSGNSTPAHGTVTCSSSSCTYTPAADFNGADAFSYTVTDGQGGSSTATVSVTVSAASAEQDVPADGTVSTGGDAPTAAEPVWVEVMSPTAGTVAIADHETATTPVTGYHLFGIQVDISAPAATVADPLRLTFLVDGSKLVPPAASLDAALADLAVFRNGTLVGACPGSATASPDPCVTSARLVGGDLEVVVLTSRASTWNLGVKAPAPAPDPKPAPAPTPTPTPVGEPVKAVTGYWIAAADGSVMSYGSAPRFGGSLAGQALNHPIVGLEATPTGQGYWLVARDGGVFAFGDAVFHGSTGAIVLNQPIVGMAATPTGKGYWLVASDGGIFAFGDAAFHGSTGDIKLNKPIVGMESTPSGKGYWLVATDGGIFTFGDANFLGSTGAMVLNKPIVGMTTSPTGKGYWLVASDGGIFTFGDTGFFGSTGDIVLNQPIIAMSSTPSAKGYWLVARDGGLFTFGDAAFHGAAAGILSAPAIGAAW